MSARLITRRRFIVLSAAGVLGAGGYGLTRAVQRVRESASRLTSQ
jgi:hypothetical protein